jgi:uncharacterized protein
MLSVNLESLYHSPVSTVLELEQEGNLNLPSDVSPHPAKIIYFLKLTRLDDGILVSGKLKTHINSNCDRCLKSFDLKLDSNFDQLLSLSETIHLKKYEFNLEPLFTELVILENPIRKLCKSGCKGICQKCGQDLNVISCKCKNIEKNNPFSVLKQGKNGSTKEKNIKG